MASKSRSRKLRRRDKRRFDSMIRGVDNSVPCHTQPHGRTGHVHCRKTPKRSVFGYSSRIEARPFGQPWLEVRRG